MDQVAQEWHDQRLLHPGLEEMRLDLKRRFAFPPGLSKTVEAVCGSCQVCRAVKQPDQPQAGKANWTPVPHVPMESVAIDKFAMPPVRHGTQVYDCVILCVDRHSSYLVAVPAKDKGLTAEAVARQMISHWLTVFGTPKAIYSDNGSHFTSVWLRTMCRLMGVHPPWTVAYHSRSNGRAEVAGRQLFEQLKQLHLERPGRN